MLLEMNVKLRRGHFHLAAQISLNDTSTLQPQSGHISLDGKIYCMTAELLVWAKTQHFGRVAEISHVSQPSLSTYIRARPQLVSEFGMVQLAVIYHAFPAQCQASCNSPAKIP